MRARLSKEGYLENLYLNNMEHDFIQIFAKCFFKIYFVPFYVSWDSYRFSALPSNRWSSISTEYLSPRIPETHWPSWARAKKCTNVIVEKSLIRKREEVINIAFELSNLWLSFLIEGLFLKKKSQTSLGNTQVSISIIFLIFFRNFLYCVCPF